MIHKIDRFEMLVHLDQLIEGVHVFLGFGKHRDFTTLLVYGGRLPTGLELLHNLDFLVYVPPDFVLHFLGR